MAWTPPNPLSPRARRALWALLGAGVLIRGVLAFASVGVSFDIESFRLVGAELDDRPLHFYGALNQDYLVGGAELYRWPYPSGFVPWIAASVGLEKAGLPFHGVIQLPSIAADAGIAWVVQACLGARGYGERVRLVAAALVALGPSFIAVSGYHGQIDAVAILPALVALYVWERADPARRALLAGALIGAGGAVKTVPLLMVIALLPSARSWREAAQLLGAAAAVPLLAMAPFLAADADGVFDSLRYAGAPGLGGLSLVVQPALADSWLKELPLDFTGATRALYDGGTVVMAAGLGALAAFLLRFRPPALQAVVLLWLTVYVFNPNFFMQYLVWGLPFFLIAGHLWKVAALQVALLPATVILFARPWESDVPTVVYVATMLPLWVVWVVALVLSARDAAPPRPHDRRTVARYSGA